MAYYAMTMQDSKRDALLGYILRRSSGKRHWGKVFSVSETKRTESLLNHDKWNRNITLIANELNLQYSVNNLLISCLLKVNSRDSVGLSKLNVSCDVAIFQETDDVKYMRVLRLNFSLILMRSFNERSSEITDLDQRF